MRKLGVLLLVVGLSLNGWSQNRGVFSDFGILVGPGLSHVFGGESWNPAFGFMLGAETNVYEMNETSALKVGIVFTMQGAAYKEVYSDIYGMALKSALALDIEYSGKVTLSYIGIPIMYNYRSDNGLYVEAGIQPAFLISAKDKYEGESIDYKDYINSLDIGIPVGAGYWINERISVGARAVFGLTNINDESSMDYSSDESDRNFILMGTVKISVNK